MDISYHNLYSEIFLFLCLAMKMAMFVIVFWTFLAVECRKLIFVQLYTILKLEYVVFQIAAFGEKYHYGDRKKISTTQLTWL